MRRDLNKPEIPWGIRVSAEDETALSSVLPMNGGKTWLIITGLRAFMDLMEHSLSHREWAKAQVILHNQDLDKPRRAKEINVRVPTDLYMRFIKVFPEHGAASWFVRTLISATINELSESGPSMDDRISMIVNQAMSPREATVDPVVETIHQGPDQ